MEKDLSYVISGVESLKLTENQVLGIVHATNSLITVDASSPDLISLLPEPILHHILDFLPVEEAARVAVLSKTWFQVWNTLPILDFDRSYGEKNIQKSDMLLPYIDQILSKRKNQHLNINKFTFGGRFPKNLSSYLEGWIGILRDLHINHLCVHNYISKNEYVIAFPETILSANSIKYLKLSSFNLGSLCPKSVKWPLLQKLHLTRVHISDILIREIVTNCCGVENLKFSCCTGFKDITISNLIKLRKFIIHAFYFGESPNVNINVPSLECFSYCAANTQNCFNINDCTRLKSLSLSGRGITQDWFDKLFSLFPLLESLSLSDYMMLAKVNISSCNLKYLSLDDDNLLEANIDTPNLSTFDYYGNGALSFSLNAPAFLEVDAILWEKFPINLVECTKVTKFLTAFGYSKLVSLGSFSFQDWAFPKEIRDVLNYPPCKLKNLLLNISCKPDTGLLNAAFDVLDYLFRVYSQLESLWIVASEDDIIASLKSLYEKLRDKDENLYCCDSLSVKCWRHFLKEVIFKTPGDDEDRWMHKLNTDWVDFINDREKSLLRINLMPR